jgi:beta-glucosidase
MELQDKCPCCKCRHKLEPVVTLHHFVHPQWFEDLGGFTEEANIPHFVRFSEWAYR